MSLRYSQALIDFLRTTRRSQSLTLDQVAVATGMAKTTVHSLENGAGFTFLTFIILCECYKLLPSTVFEFAELTENIGIDGAYDQEYPHLKEFRRPYGYRNPRTDRGRYLSKPQKELT